MTVFPAKFMADRIAVAARPHGREDSVARGQDAVTRVEDARLERD
jgi:hypothetical protein